MTIGVNIGVSAEGSPTPRGIDEYALSVLLHDIGKFWERSSDAPRPGPAELKTYCPQATEGGAYLHSHAALSGRFVKDLVAIPGAELWGPRHHLPDLGSREEVCAQLGDRLAAGELTPDDTRDAPNAATVPLRADFAAVSPVAGEAPPPRWFPLVRLDQLPESMTSRHVVLVSREDYRFHWNHFLAAIDKLGAPLQDLETWLHLLEVFASRMPAGGTSRQLKSIPDIDLFTHSRLASALASALYGGPLALPELLDLRGRMQRPPVEGEKDAPIFRLITGRIAGAHRFHQTRGFLRQGQGAAIARGRSLFLEMALEAIARRLAGRLGLPLVCVLSRGLDRFVLLAPAGAEHEEALEEHRDEAEAVLASHARGELGFESASQDLRLSDFRSGLGAAAARLEERLDAAERARLSRLARTDYDRLFGEVDRDPSPAECRHCGGAARADGAPADGAPSAAACELCASLEELGEHAGAARLLILPLPAGAQGAASGAAAVLAAQRSYAAVLAAFEFSLEMAGPEESARLADARAVYTLGRLDLEMLQRVRTGFPAGARTTFGFRWWPVEAASTKPEPARGPEVRDRHSWIPRIRLRKPQAETGGGGASLARFVIVEEQARLLFQALAPHLAAGQPAARIFLATAGGWELEIHGSSRSRQAAELAGELVRAAAALGFQRKALDPNPEARATAARGATGSSLGDAIPNQLFLELWRGRISITTSDRPGGPLTTAQTLALLSGVRSRLRAARVLGRVRSGPATEDDRESWILGGEGGLYMDLARMVAPLLKRV